MDATSANLASLVNEEGSLYPLSVHASGPVSIAAIWNRMVDQTPAKLSPLPWPNRGAWKEKLLEKQNQWFLHQGAKESIRI